MGRGNLIRTALLAVVAAAVFAAAASAAVSWQVVATGKTEPGAVRQPVGYISLTRTQERTWIGRVGTSAKVAPTTARAIVAVFLDGLPCVSNPATTSVTRSGSTLTVHMLYTRPPIGMAMCVRTSTPYMVLGIPRAALGRTPPTHVAVAARARA